jgi:GNAT superfamily N-acetyltransferase
MTSKTSVSAKLGFKPLTQDCWEDFTELFGKNGAYGGCWCMWWRVSRREFEAQQGEKNRQSIKTMVDAGEIPGIIAYLEGRPVGWCAMAPRETFSAIERSPVLKRVDDQPVWSLPCFFIRRQQRSRGVAGALIQAAIEFVKSQGGTIIEAYPTRPRSDQKLPPVSSFMGVPALFKKAGFEECARPSDSRVIMRYYIK